MTKGSQSKFPRVSLTVAGLAALTLAVCGLASRYVPITNHIALWTAALSPYLMLFAPLSVLLLIAARKWVLAISAVALTVAVLAIQLPLYLGSGTGPTQSLPLRVLTANLREGHADSDSLVRTAREHADILAVQELTPEAVDRLSSSGLDTAFPYRWLDARGSANGVGLWSRFPLSETRQINGHGMPSVSARVQMPGNAPGVTVVVVHIPGPWPEPLDDWSSDLDRWPVTLSEVADRAGGAAVVVAGDFNATIDMQPFRGLLRNGYRDAAEQSGAGIQPTFPANSPIPRLVAIDHFLTRNAAATSLHTVTIVGSDHRGLVATIKVRR